MATTSSIVSLNSLALFQIRTCDKTKAGACSLNLICCLGGFKGRRAMINTSKMIRKSRDVRVYNSILPSGPINTSDPSSDTWKGWVLGRMLSIIIPFWKNKWGPLLQLKSSVEEVVQTVEDMTEAVEEVADKVEELAEDVVEKIPDGKLKQVVSSIEKAAERVSRDAHLADEVIDKLQEVDKEMETLILRIVDEGKEITKDVKEISKDANEIRKEANAIAKDVNKILKEADEIVKDVNDLNKM